MKRKLGERFFLQALITFPEKLDNSNTSDFLIHVLELFPWAVDAEEVLSMMDTDIVQSVTNSGLKRRKRKTKKPKRKYKSWNGKAGARDAKIAKNLISRFDSCVGKSTKVGGFNMSGGDQVRSPSVIMVDFGGSQSTQGEELI